LLSVAVTLSLLRNKWIPFYQALNFIWSLSNYPGSGTMLFNITIYTISTSTSANTVNISSSVSNSVVLFLSEAYSSVILNNLSIYSNISIVMVCLDTNIFLCFYNEEACDCGHITCYMMWGHRPRIWEKELEEWCQGTYIWHSILIEDMRLIYDGSMNYIWILE